MISFREIAERMDPVRVPSRLRGSTKPPRESYEKWYYEPLIAELPYADRIGRIHQFDKGLAQLYRTLDGQPIHSFREIAKRHANPNRHFKFLWYNTWLIDPPGSDYDPPELKRRAYDIGHRIGQGPWDVVALCELFDEEKRDWLFKAIGQHRQYQATWGGSDDFALASSGLVTLGLNGIVPDHHDFHSFDAEASSMSDIEGFASKGVLYQQLHLRKPGNPEEFIVNLFTTHLHAEDSGVRTKQIQELVKFVNSKKMHTSPTIIAGDFNVRDMGGKRYSYVPSGAGPGEWSVMSEFDKLLRSLSDFEDLGLTCAGLSAASHSKDDYTLSCEFDPATPWQDRLCQDYPTNQLTHDNVPGFRIDYVFLERPRKEHKFIIDTPRIRRRPMFRDSIELHAGFLGQSITPVPVLKLDPTKFWTKISPQQQDAIRNSATILGGFDPIFELALKSKYCGFLSDHLPIEVDLIITPMSEVL